MRGNAAPGWYPDPSGGGGQRYWDGAAWHDAVPVRPGVPTAGKPPRKVSTRALLIAAAVFVAIVVIGNVIENRHEDNKAASRTSSSSAQSAPASATHVPVRPLPTTPAVSAEQLNPATYRPVTERELALILKDPYAHYGEPIIIYGKVVQFDTNTGNSAFRADVLAEPGGRSADAIIEAADPTILANVVEGDSLTMYVEVAGPRTYSTQIGGERTVPVFDIYIAEHWTR